MWKTRLYWFRKDEGDFGERETKMEAEARTFAETRSKQVQGGCYVLKHNSPVAWYENGVDTMAPVAEPAVQ
jgi:hypothetical protein